MLKDDIKDMFNAKMNISSEAERLKMGYLVKNGSFRSDSLQNKDKRKGTIAKRSFSQEFHLRKYEDVGIRKNKIS